MAINTLIEWTLRTANLWHGCTRVHAGCDNCYACALSKRLGRDIWGNDHPRRLVNSIWKDLANYQKWAEQKGEIHNVFVGSMMDAFEKSMPVIQLNGNPSDDFFSIAGNELTTGHLRDYFFEVVIPNSPNLFFQLLTKRPSNINKYIPKKWRANPPNNVIFGTSPVDQKTFDTLVDQLRQVNGKRFLSIEPQLAEITNIDLTGIDWVIQGGESGPSKRYFDTNWARRMRDECKNQNVPYFFKQIDKVQEIPEDLKIREFPSFAN